MTILNVSFTSWNFFQLLFTARIQWMSVKVRLDFNCKSLVTVALMGDSIDTTWKFQTQMNNFIVLFIGCSRNLSESRHTIAFEHDIVVLQSEHSVRQSHLHAFAFPEWISVLPVHFNIIKSSAENHLISVSIFISTTKRMANSHATVCSVLSSKLSKNTKHSGGQ